MQKSGWVIRAVREVSFLALGAPGLLKAALTGIADAALAEAVGDQAVAYADLDALFKREVGIALADLPLIQRQVQISTDPKTP